MAPTLPRSRGREILKRSLASSGISRIPSKVEATKSVSYATAEKAVIKDEFEKVSELRRNHLEISDDVLGSGTHGTVCYG